MHTLADSHIKGNETFSLVLSNPQGVDFPVGLVELTAQRTIIDDITLLGVTQLGWLLSYLANGGLPLSP